MMFLREDNTKIEELYNKTTRLFMYIDTLETFLKCSPLYPKIICDCDQVDLDNLETPREFISDELRSYYKKIYSRLFTCMQILISSIPSGMYDRIKYDPNACMNINDIDENLPCRPILKDYNMDFSYDFRIDSPCHIV